MVCSRCRVSLAVSERVMHYQSPWHLLNLRRSLSKRCVGMDVWVHVTVEGEGKACVCFSVYVREWVA